MIGKINRQVTTKATIARAIGRLKPANCTHSHIPKTIIADNPIVKAKGESQNSAITAKITITIAERTRSLSIEFSL